MENDVLVVRDYSHWVHLFEIYRSDIGTIVVTRILVGAHAISPRPRALYDLKLPHDLRFPRQRTHSLETQETGDEKPLHLTDSCAQSSSFGRIVSGALQEIGKGIKT